jgi:hypothetical protein
MALTNAMINPSKKARSPLLVRLDLVAVVSRARGTPTWISPSWTLFWKEEETVIIISVLISV